ncbi:MAG: hypothetical protein LBB98_04195 [Treponema sp.]|jgi:hypothetical protein|nr:hypothetical protein [Treponema sp.]
MQERRTLTSERAVPYRKSDKTGKKRILDEFTQISACLRKYAITLLTHQDKQRLRLGALAIQSGFDIGPKGLIRPSSYGDDL